MACSEIPIERRSGGHVFQHIRIDKGAKAHLGDSYHFIQESPLKSLPYAKEAPFNSFANQHHPICLSNTRIDLLQKIYSWADGQDERCLCWLNGLAGTGKSTIARTVARRYFEQKRLGASFFFSRGGGDVGSADKFVTSIALQLASCNPSLSQYICDALTERRDITSLSLRDQWQQLVLHPLSQLGSKACQSSYILVVDALDECDNYDNIRIIIDLLGESRSLKTILLRVFLTSRPNIPIRRGLPDAEHLDFVLQDISRSIVNHDISVFLHHHLEIMSDKYYHGTDWPGEHIIEQLVHSAHGIFNWAATACRFIEEGRSLAPNRLSIVLKTNSMNDSTDLLASDDSTTDGDGNDALTPEKHLDELYITVLRNSLLQYRRSERKEWRKVLGTTLGTIAVLSSPLSIQSLSKLLDTKQNTLKQTLNDLCAILDIPEDSTHPLRLHHPSFRDFLLDDERCGELKFRIIETQTHENLATLCIQLMSNSLSQDILRVGRPGALATDLETSRVEQYLPAELQYACLYWVQHLQRSKIQLHDGDQVDCFLQKYLLQWLEALGWMGKVPEGVHAIVSLQSIVSSCDCPVLSNFIYDAKRFVLYNRPAIEQAPLQVYGSALVFAPMTSIIREKFFDDYKPSWMKLLPKVEENWNAVLLTVEDYLPESGSVSAVAFSPDGKTLVSASDHMIRVWDAGSGALRLTLNSHGGRINAVAFSPDNKTLASASNDSIVRVWDAVSGALLHTLKDHSQERMPTYAMARTPANDKILSRLHDYVTKVRSTKGHLGSVNAVAFSLDNKTLASASSDRTVMVWDAGSGTLQQTLEGHSESINAVAFSPESNILVSGSDDMTVMIWNIESGTLQRTLKGHSGSVKAVAFSPESKTLLVSGSDDKTVKIWDTESGRLRHTIKGHSDIINSVTFLQDSKIIVSASDNDTVVIWNIESGVLQQTLKGPLAVVNAVAFSPDSKTIASAPRYGNGAVMVWEARPGVPQQTFEGHSESVNQIVFSPDGKTLVSASDDCTVKVWDTRSGAVQQTLKAHSEPVQTVAFSPNGKILASISFDDTIKAWDTRTGILQQTLKGDSYWCMNLAFSRDSKMLASTSSSCTVYIWDTKSETPQQTLKGHENCVLALAFSPNGKTLASAAWDGTINVWDARLGTLQQTLYAHSQSAIAVAFSPDSKTLASAALDHTVKVWDTRSGALRQTLSVEKFVNTLSFSDDGTSVQTNIGTLRLSRRQRSSPNSSHSSTGLAVPEQQPSPVISVKDHWVYRHMEPLLWLPPEYRPYHFAVHGNCLGFGYESGRVIIMKLAL